MTTKKLELEQLEETLRNKTIHACEVYSRIVGYFRPIKQWNDGKKEEWANRAKFKVPDVTQKG